MANTSLKMIGPMDSYCWYDPITDQLKCRMRMECREKFGPVYYKGVVCSISIRALELVPEGSEQVMKPADRWEIEE
jgi:hypothetical protein